MALRVVVKGASGAGKTTLAEQLARKLDVPHIEIDALFHLPNWTPAPDLAERIEARLQDERARRGWVVDGNYDSKIGRLVLDRADLVVWLDLPLHVKMRRLLQRTRRRIGGKEVLWNGNRESWKGVFWGMEALVPWTVHTHFKSRLMWPTLLAGKTVVRLRSVEEVRDWLARL